MSIRPRFALRVDRPTIAPLVADPAYVAAAAVRAALVTAKGARERDIEIIALEADAARPAGSNRGPRGVLVQERLAMLRAATPASPTAPADAGDLPPAIARGLRLAAGEAIAPEPNRAARLQRLRAELDLLDLALRQAEERFNDIRAELSYRVAVAEQANHNDRVAAVFHAAAALAAAMDEERAGRVAVLLAGYDDVPHVLHRPAMSGAARLGSAGQYDSEINREQRRLVALGVLT